MAQDGRPRSVSRSFSDEEWEQHRNHFYHFYIEKNMSLKEAAQCMKENYGFDATPRQWERRIAPDRWGFQKYESREQRLKQIESSGKSLLEVSTRGRRKSTASDGRPPLNEDRNLRRFARREVSRDARRRSHSVGGNSDMSDQESDMGDDPSQPEPNFITGLQHPSQSFQHTQDSFPGSLDVSNWHSQTSATDMVDMPPRIDRHESQPTAIPQIFIFNEHAMPESQNITPFGNMRPDEEMMVYTDNVSEQFNRSGIPSNQNEFNPQLTSNEDVTQFHTPQSVPWEPSFNSNNNSQPLQPSIHEPLDFGVDMNNPSFTDLMDQESIIMDGEQAVNRDEFTGINESFGFGAGGIPHEAQDPIHADVHELLTWHANKINDMVTTCINDCSAAQSKSAIIQSLDMLKLKISAQNDGANQQIKRTLTNVALTQRRANQSVKDLCTNLRRRNEQLKSQNAMLQSMIDDPSMTFSPTHAQNPWTMS